MSFSKALPADLRWICLKPARSMPGEQTAEVRDAAAQNHASRAEPAISDRWSEVCRGYRLIEARPRANPLPASEPHVRLPVGRVGATSSPVPFGIPAATRTGQKSISTSARMKVSFREACNLLSRIRGILFPHHAPG